MKKLGRVLLAIATVLFLANAIFSLVVGFIDLSKLPNGLSDIANSEDQALVLVLFITGGLCLLTALVSFIAARRNKAGFFLVVFALVMLASLIYSIVTNITSGAFTSTDGWKNILSFVIHTFAEVLYIVGTFGILFRGKKN